MLLSLGATGCRRQLGESAAFWVRLSRAGTWRRPLHSGGPAVAARAGLIVAFSLSVLAAAPVSAADLDAARLLYNSGQYHEAAEIARKEIDRGIWNERWGRLLIRCQLTTGQYEQALATYEAAMRRYSHSLTLRMLGVRVLRAAGQLERAAEAQAEIFDSLRRTPSRFASSDNLIAAGRYFAERGEDARRVLTLFYDRVREADPEHLEAYIATAELALQKGDFRVAAETMDQAEAIDGTDPRVFYLKARAWAPSDPERAGQALARALELNPKHVDSLLFQVDRSIDREQYERAERLIQDVLQVNIHEPAAWAYRAVLAHVRGDFEREAVMRRTALSTWSKNPEVDHLIGRKLSDKYRFREGSEYQWRALEMDPEYAAAEFQLAQDLLRLGKDEVGWELARTVAEEDPYNVVAHNLVTLYDRLESFRTLHTGDIHVRMDPREAKIYGQEVLDVLSEARAVLCEKYDVEPEAPIVVEIFPEQKDFAIRTFGLPGGAGYLGVCFGRVITANSPASQGPRPSNWKSVLWHEFCHVVTLEKTRNRMPRWLSEGISVYEERQRDPAWGETMTPKYREMLLSDELTPVSELSAAFLNPPSPVHLQFAYYQASLVVEFLIERHGLAALKGILSDLGDGLTINDALVRHAGSLGKLDAQFAEFARRRAEAFAPEADWSRQELPQSPDAEAWQTWLEEHPDSYWALRSLAEALVRAGRYQEAVEPLERLRQLGTVSGQRGGVLEMLAQVYRELEKPKAEREVLEATLEVSSDALPALKRLMELERDEQDWESVLAHANDFLSIHPLTPLGHQRMAEAAERLERPAEAVAALEALAEMEPVDPVGLHYRTASSLAQLGRREQAKRHVLRALEDAPRYRAALALLLQLAEDGSAAKDTVEDDASAPSGRRAVSDGEQVPPEASGEQPPEPTRGSKSETDAATEAGASLLNRSQYGRLLPPLAHGPAANAVPQPRQSGEEAVPGRATAGSLSQNQIATASFLRRTRLTRSVWGGEADSGSCETCWTPRASGAVEGSS